MSALRITAVAFCYVLALSPAAFSQATAAVQEPAAAIAAARQPYSRALAPNPQLLNGPEYLDYAKRYHARTGHQFFLVPEMQTGSVYYNDHLFTNVQLAYDLVLDQVVLSPPHSPLTLRLIGEKVSDFTISGHHFTRLVADSTSGEGYAHRLVRGAARQHGAGAGQACETHAGAHQCNSL